MEWLRNLCRSSARRAAAESGSTDLLSAGGLELPLLFARDSANLQVLELAEQGSHCRWSAGRAPRAAAWSPDGSKLAVVDPLEGLAVIRFGTSGAQKHTVNRAGNFQVLQWSPLGSRLVAQAPASGDEEPNVLVWRTPGHGQANGESYACEASFRHPKCERNLLPFHWTSDERLCIRQLPDGKLQLLEGGNLANELSTLGVHKDVQSFQFAPASNDTPARLAVFIADSRDALQRVVAPAEVVTFEVSEGSAVQCNSAAVQFGQQAELLWSPTSTAVLAHCQTDTDDSGQSYYGGSKLMLVSHDGNYSLDLTQDKESVVQAVAWSPRHDEFVLVQGFQPAKVSIWSWDAKEKTCSQTAVLQEKAHRNTIRWNQLGSMVCVAGFGNLAGEVDFFGRTSRGLQRVASASAACTVTADWAPDGRHLLTAVLAPRMRVDNGLSVWSAFSGSKVADLASEELLEVHWRPSATASGPCEAEVEEMLDGAASGASSGLRRQAYRPPTARDNGVSTVARMMRGDVQSKPREPESSSSRAGVPSHSREQPQPRAAAPNISHGAKCPCPAEGWQYRDPKGNVQGPFTLEQMQKWYSAGKLKSQLPMRCDPDDPFVPMGELFPHPMIPFHRAPKRPTR